MSCTRGVWRQIALRGALLVAGVLLAVIAPAVHARALVVGGHAAAPGAWPSIAYIEVIPSVGAPYFCGGTVVDPSWIVTAGHCTFDDNNAVVLPGQVTAVLGIYNLNSAPFPPPIEVHTVDQVIPHPAYASGIAFDNDIALLHLTTPATIGPSVATSDLPLPSAQLAPGTPAMVAGWGLTQGGTVPDPPNLLQEATVAVLTDASCTNHGPAYKPALMVCAGTAGGGVDACQGDSGGPLLAPNLPGKPLVGIVSFGQGCALAAFPGVYTRTSTYRDFIYGHLGVTAPGPPVNAHVDASGNLSWNPPASGGGRPVNYTITASRGNAVIAQVQTTVTTVAPADFGGALIEGNRYGYTIAAESAAGTGGSAALPQPAFTIIRSVAPRVIQTTATRRTISIGVAAEPKAKLAITVLDARGKIRSLDTKRSRIDGRVPVASGPRIVATTNSTSSHRATVSIKALGAGRLQTIRIVVSATSTLGETAKVVLKVRVRL